MKVQINNTKEIELIELDDSCTTVNVNEIITQVKTYVKKPIKVEAIIWTGSLTCPVREFLKSGNCSTLRYVDDKDLYIGTLEGEMKCNVGDYIIKGVKGEFYPCKPDIFKQTYEEVTPVKEPTIEDIVKKSMEVKEC